MADVKGAYMHFWTHVSRTVCEASTKIKFASGFRMEAAKTAL